MVRVAIHPFEEADKWPATKQWLDIMKKDGPADAKVASLGVQSFSAGLLFATAVERLRQVDGRPGRPRLRRERGQEDHEVGRRGPPRPVRPVGQEHRGLLDARRRQGRQVRAEVTQARRARTTPSTGSTATRRVWSTIQGDFGKGNVDPSLPY